MTSTTVYPIKVQNINAPWVEICKLRNQTGDRPRNYIVIEPIVANDPLDIRDVLPIFDNENNDDKNVNYGDYSTDLICHTENGDDVSILKVSVACLKNSVSLKHAHMSTYIALTDLLRHINDYNVIETHYFPDIILNTKCDANTAPLTSYSEITREIIASYINQYDMYPNIFVTFSDSSSLKFESKHKKKKKKKNKKK